jgi:hypothetical protein
VLVLAAPIMANLKKQEILFGRINISPANQHASFVQWINHPGSTG